MDDDVLWFVRMWVSKESRSLHVLEHTLHINVDRYDLDDELWFVCMWASKEPKLINVLEHTIQIQDELPASRVFLDRNLL